MSVRQALFQLHRPLSRRAWNGATRGVFFVREFSTATSRWHQAAQEKSVADGVSPHIAGAPAGKVAFEDHSGESVKPSFSKRVTVDLDGKPTIFDSIFLRDSCRCPRCLDPSTSQKIFQTADIPATIEGSCQVCTELENDDIALISWKDDIKDWPEGHQTALPLEFLRNSMQQERDFIAQQYNVAKRTFWTRRTMSREVAFLDYGSYMRNDKTLYHALKMLHTHGLVFLRNVPDTTATDSSTSVASIVERIGNIRQSFYGRTWDVRSVPNAKNVAYTHVYLGLHMDLCYMDLTPHLQFLHSMRARAPGGESMFSDSFYAAERMRRESPELFEALCSFPVTFHYFNDGYAYRQIRNTVELVEQSNYLNAPIKLMNWSPPFQGPFANDIGTADNGRKLRTFHAATQKFDELINAEENMFEYRMEEGDCVLFDNRRVLHARRGFEAEKGERWLKGAYCDRDVYASKLAVLEKIYGR